VDLAGDIAASRQLADTTVNLAHRTTVADTSKLVQGLERAVREVGQRG